VRSPEKVDAFASINTKPARSIISHIRKVRRRLLRFFLRLLSGMRRIVKSDQRPFEIKPQQESVWICMCGLSKNQPFCDGSHKTTRDEENGKTYEYDAEGHRHEI
jgi:CDGSH-type Zn-finger protein